MEESLRGKTFWGVIWSYVNRFGTQVIAIVPTMILARLISPSEYGLLAMTAVFTGVASQLADGGFGNALVQKKNADHLDFCSVFFFNLGICGLVYIAFWFLAPFFASFFDEDRLVTIIRVTTLNILFGALGQIHSIIFKKEIDYKRPAIRNIFVQIISAIIAVCMAFAGYGVWALVMQGLSQTLLGSFFNWVISSWRPTLCFSFHRLKMLFSFGSKLFFRSIIDYLFDKMYDVVIGRFYSAASLAFYNRGIASVTLFSGTFWGVFGGVLFPILVQIQDDNVKLKNIVRKFVRTTSLVFFSGVLTVLVLAEPFFNMMYSSKWDAAIPLFQLLCLSALILPLLQIVESVLWAKGESGRVLFLSVIYKILIAISVLITWRLGIGYMIVGQFLCELVELIVYLCYVNRMIDYGFSDFICDIWKNLIVAVLLAGALICFDNFIVWLIKPQGYEFLFSSIRCVLGAMIAIFAFFSVHKKLGLNSYRELLLFLIDNIGNNSLMKRISP